MSVIIFLLCLLPGVTPDKCSTTTTEPESTTTETVPTTSTPQDDPKNSVVGKVEYNEGIKNCNKENRRILTAKSEEELQEFIEVAEHFFEYDTEITSIWLPFRYDNTNDKIFFSDGQEGNSWIRERLDNVRSLDSLPEQLTEMCYLLYASEPSTLRYNICDLENYSICERID